jgi:kynurenine formamidase
MRRSRLASSARIGLVALLVLHGQGGAALAGALERAMIGKSPIVDLTRPAPESAPGAEAHPGIPGPPVTRLYAPIGAPRGQRTVSQIPARDLLLHAVVIDISAMVARQADYRLDVEALRAWERKHGRIAKRSAVLLRAGVQADPLPLGGSAPAPLPGFQPAALAFLLQQRDIRAVGQDGPMVHSAHAGPVDLAPAGRAATIQVENLTNLDRLPPKGAKVIIAPLLVAEESAPARVIAILP